MEVRKYSHPTEISGLKSGAVVDVEFILGDTKTPKTSELA